MSIKRENIILIGAGGHCKSCIDIIESTGKFSIAGIFGKLHEVGEKVLGYEVIGTDDDIETFAKKAYSFIITVGQIKSAQARKKIFEKLRTSNSRIATIISPFARVSKYAQIGEGSIVMHFATMNAASCIGENCILNTGCNVEHDAVIGDHTHISTHAVINGNSRVGDECFVGSNATVSSQVSIGNKIIVGAGSVVINNIPNEGVYAGNPAKRINHG